MAHSLASAPLLAKKTLPPPPSNRSRGPRHFLTGQRAEQVGGVHERLRGLAHRLGHSRVSMAERGHREPGEEIEVPAPLFVPKVTTFAPYKRDTRRGICRHEMGHGITIVPIPLRVKILEQEGMRRPPVQDVSLSHAPADGVDGGPGLGDHAPGHGPLHH